MDAATGAHRGRLFVINKNLLKNMNLNKPYWILFIEYYNSNSNSYRVIAFVTFIIANPSICTSVTAYLRRWFLKMFDMVAEFYIQKDDQDVRLTCQMAMDKYPVVPFWEDEHPLVPIFWCETMMDDSRKMGKWSQFPRFWPWHLRTWLVPDCMVPVPTELGHVLYISHCVNVGIVQTCASIN